jgi:hypothetical protein
MLHEYKTAPSAWQAEPLSEWLSAQIELLLVGKLGCLTCSVSFPVSKTNRCIFCLETVASFQLASGEWFNAELETDDQGVTFAVVTQPHRCPESLRWEHDEDEGEGEL